ncbi:TPA: hypothetical protein ACYHQW_002818, partial [Staphylococcus aureus]
FMEEVLIDDNMVFDIDNLKGFLNDTSSFGFIAKENNKIIGFAYCYTLLRPDGKTMFYLHSIGMWFCCKVKNHVIFILKNEK